MAAAGAEILLGTVHPVLGPALIVLFPPAAAAIALTALLAFPWLVAPALAVGASAGLILALLAGPEPLLRPPLVMVVAALAFLGAGEVASRRAMAVGAEAAGASCMDRRSFLVSARAAWAGPAGFRGRHARVRADERWLIWSHAEIAFVEPPTGPRVGLLPKLDLAPPGRRFRASPFTPRWPACS